MPQFRATVLDAQGRRHPSTVDARSADEARAQLRKSGLFVETIVSATRNPRRLARIKISHRNHIHFFQQMQMLLGSGILIPDALRKLRDRFPDPATRQVLRYVYDHVAESTGSLSGALAAFPRSFPAVVVSVIAAGEDAGTATLAERFGDLAERLAYEQANRRQVFKACAYPLFVASLAALLCVFLLAAVFPRLTELLGSLGGKLPPLTRGLISLSAVVRDSWLIVVAALVALPLAVIGLRAIPNAGLLIDRLFLRLPLLGAIYRQLTVALVCTIYRSLYRSNKSAPEIIDACCKVVGNREFLRGLGEVRDKVMLDGTALSRALEESGLFPPIACMAIEVGEQSGKLADALDRVARYHAHEAKESIATLVALLNPTMTIAVVGGVGLVMISFFQAIYQVVYVAH